MKINKWLVLAALFFTTNACYKTKEEPDYLRNEYLTIADFQYYYNDAYDFEDSVYVKVQGWVDEKSYNDFLSGLDTARYDTGNSERYYFKIVDYTSGFTANVCVISYHTNIPLSNWYYFFKAHQNYNYLYVKGIIDINPLCCNIFPNSYPVYYGKDIIVTDTTDLIFENR